MDIEDSTSSKAKHQMTSVSEAMLDLKITNDTGKSKHNMTSSDAPSPLTTSKLGNVQTPWLNGAAGHHKVSLRSFAHNHRH